MNNTIYLKYQDLHFLMSLCLVFLSRFVRRHLGAFQRHCLYLFCWHGNCYHLTCTDHAVKLGRQRAWVGTRTNLFLNLSVEEINQSKCLVKIPHGCQIFPNTARKPEVSKKSKANFSCQGMSSYGWCSMEKLAGDLLLGLKFVK